MSHHCLGFQHALTFPVLPKPPKPVEVEVLPNMPPPADVVVVPNKPPWNKSCFSENVKWSSIFQNQNVFDSEDLIFPTFHLIFRIFQVLNKTIACSQETQAACAATVTGRWGDDVGGGGQKEQKLKNSCDWLSRYSYHATENSCEVRVQLFAIF